MYDSTVFRLYDIRGIAEKDFDSVFVRTLARAFATMLHQKGETSCVVGRDARETSPTYHHILVTELASRGIRVWDVGAVPTPLTYFACFIPQWPTNAIMVTASHNPKEYNGFKFVLQQMPFFGEHIGQLRKRMQDDQVTSKVSTSASIVEADVETPYLRYLKSHLHFSKPHRILVDCGNGMTGSIARKVFDLFGFDTTILYEDVDGRFPNHPADPLIADNLKDMIAILSKPNHGFELGVGYDGDGDRIGIVTPLGRLLYGDHLLLLLTGEMVRKYSHPVVIGDVKSSQVFYREAKRLGAIPVMYKTGHSVLKAKLYETQNCPLAGEMSGHIFIKDDFFGYDDALYATLRIIRTLENISDGLEGWAGRLPPVVNTPEIQVPCPDAKKSDVMAVIVERCQTMYQDAELILVDGIRIAWENRWALIRPSNTIPALTLRCEAENVLDLQALVTEINDLAHHAVAKICPTL